MSQPDQDVDHLWDVLRIAAALHGAHIGSGDPIDDDQRDRWLAALRNRIANWHEGHPRAVGYDNAVRALLEAAVAEYDGGGA